MEVNNKWGKLYFVFEGVSSCAYLWINSQYVGFTQGSHLQAEFDITDYINEGNNMVTVKVLKWCCGRHLEDQDFFRFNGIFRDCYILQRPLNNIEDGKIHLRVDYKVSGLGSYSCGPELLEKYRLSEKKIKFGFAIQPYK